MDKIANEFGCGKNWVVRTLKRLNIESRDLSESHIVYDRDSNFFSRIDTEEKAYFLGFLYADGNIKGNTLQLCIHPQDEAILVRLQRALNTNQPIRDDRKYKRFNIRDNQLTSDLIKNGCVERKTFILKFPNEEIVPTSLLHHFMRGYFDGDGSISIGGKYCAWHLSVVSCFNFLGEYHKVFAKNCALNLNKLYREKRHDTPIYTMSYGGTSNATLMRIYDYLYKNATIFLQRKHDKFVLANTQIEERISNRKNFGSLGKEEKERRIKIMIDNSDKPLRVVADMIGINSVSLGELYKKGGWVLNHIN